MKKLIYFAACVALLVSAFVLAVSAAPSFGEMSPAIGDDKIPQCHIFGDEAHGSATHCDGWYNENCARVLLSYNGTTATYPAYYILENDSTLTWNFDRLSNALGVDLSLKNVVEIEIPYGITEVPRRGFVHDDHWIENGTEEKPYPHATASNYLTYVKLPNSLLTINDYAFAHCTALATVDSNRLPSGAADGNPVQGNHDHQMLQRIGVNAFHDCPITTFNFNKHLVYLGSGAFEGCHFTIIDLSKCVELKVIPNNCFHENSEYHIETIILSVSIEEIGDNAFTGASASTVFLGLSLKRIGHNAISMDDLDVFIIPTTIEELYSDSFDFGNKSYDPIIVPARDNNEDATLALIALLKEKGYGDLKQANNPGKIHDNSVSYWENNGADFCQTYLGGHIADPSSGITSVEYPNGIHHEGVALGGSCSVCSQATEQTTVRPILISKGYSICEYNGLAAFSNGFEIYHNALAVYESVYGECELGILFLLESRHIAGDLKENIGSTGICLDKSQLESAEDQLRDYAAMDFKMTYSQGIGPVNGSATNRGDEPIIIAGYLYHTDATKANGKSTCYVQDTDDLCVMQPKKDGNTYVTVSYNSINGYIKSQSETH
ncbi:MAG: leucine-rich repeat domain-containing protein [Clostridia bacterium]|nr:leucine-rich repeat domain-containing protein [Clostridia bacterium]